MASAGSAASPAHLERICFFGSLEVVDDVHEQAEQPYNQATIFLVVDGMVEAKAP